MKRPFYYDVVDVSKGFLTRIAYKKKVKSSKLDSLLERRVKQHVIEERQRQQLSASNPLCPTAVSSTLTPALSTPARPRSPLKPHTLAKTQLMFDEAIKVEEKSSTIQTPGPGDTQGQEVEAELSKTTDKIAAPLPSPASDSTPKYSCSTGTDEDSDSLRNQTTSMPQGLEERTTWPKEISLNRSGQQGVTLSDLKEATAGGLNRSLEQQTACVASDVTKASCIENTGSEVPNLKLDPVRTFSNVVDQKVSQNTSPSKPTQQNMETLSPEHSGTEENGMGPEENQQNMQSIGHGRSIGDSTPKPVSAFPQVNGNDGLLSNSVMSSNNGVLSNKTQPKLNSTDTVGEQGLSVSLKDSAQQKPLVNGDLAPVNDRTEVKEPCLVSDVEVESKITMSDQDYKPPVKITKLENNIDALGANTVQHNSTPAFQPAETKSGIKIIRMAPSPIPSAEESSLSDDFAEDNSNSGPAEPVKTIITQVTTTSSTTTTTTVVSTETRIANVPVKASGEPRVPQESTTESSAVSTLTTMTKTTVTKICSSGPGSQSEDSQGEMMTQEQKTSLSISELTADGSGKASVSSITVSQEDSITTKGRVRLLKFSRTKKMRSDTALPSYCKFITKSSRKSIFVLPHDDLKVLARRGGFREVPVFSYNAKPAPDIWPYPSPRPTFGITWR